MPETSSHTDATGEGPRARALWAERTGTREYTGRSSRGAHVLIGDGPDRFTPGELLQLALAACSALSADHRLTHALGAGFAATAGVSVQKIEEENRYEHLTVEIVTDLSPLPPEEREHTLARAEAAIERHCTVGRTLSAGASHGVIFTDEPAG